MFHRGRGKFRKIAKKTKSKKYAKGNYNYPRKKTMVKLIKSVVQRAAEVKSNTMDMTLGIGNIVNSSVMYVRTLSPSAAYMPIIGGSSSDERIGNRIRTKKVTLRYVINSLPYNSVSNLAPCPMNIIIWIGRMKRSIFSPTATDFQNLFQFGSASVPPLGDLSDLNANINTDYFTISKRIVHKLGFSDYGGTGVNVGAQSYTNNDYPYNVIRKLDLTKCFATEYLFNDADNDPQNSRTYIWMEAVRADGIVGTSAAVPCLFRGTIEYQYTDV